MKMPEPIAHFVRLHGQLVQTERAYEGLTEPLYDKQAMRELLEAAAVECQSESVELIAKWRVLEILNALKEKL